MVTHENGTLCQILRTNTEIVLIALSLYQRPSKDHVNVASLNESELLVIQSLTSPYMKLGNDSE